MPGIDSIPLAGHIAVLRDEKGQWTIGDVRSPEIAAQFVATPGSGFNHGFSPHAYWYRLVLRNSAEKGRGPAEWVLEQRFALLNYLDIYVTRDNGSTETYLTGDLRQPPPAQIPFRGFAFPLQLAPGEQVTVHLRAQTTGRHQLRLNIWTNRGFLMAATHENRRGGLAQGVFLIMALYNFIVWLKIRDRSYLYYVLFMAALLAMSLMNSGDARQYGNGLSVHAPAVINACSSLAPFVLTITALLFGREFLQMRQHVPRIHRVTSALILFGVVLIALLPLLGFRVAMWLGAFFLFGPGFLLLLIVSVYLSAKGHRSARIYLLAWSLLLLAMLFTLVHSFSGLAPTLLTQYAPPLAACLSVALLSLALANRINTERDERLSASESAKRLKSYLPQKVADLVSAGDKTLLEPKRRKVTVLVMDLRGFTPFSETTAPEDVMAVLREFYETMGAIVEKQGGTVEHFAGDSMLIFFNAPLEIPDPEKRAVAAALEMRTAFDSLRTKWSKHGHELGLGIGIADGYATIGAIGFSGRLQYAAIGAVTNLASRLCSSAAHGEILTTARVLAEVENLVESESAGEQSIRGFSRPVAVVRVLKQV